MIRRMVFIGLSAVCFMAAAPGLAAKPVVAETSTAPSEYSLSDVVFEFRTISPRNDGTLIRIAGSGKGSRVDYVPLGHDHTSEFAVNPQEVFQLLELCYRGHFFELNASYDRPNLFVRRGPKGTVETYTMVVSGYAGESVTLRIGAYSKSVGYEPEGDPPPLVPGLARRIHELAQLGEAKN